MRITGANIGFSTSRDALSVYQRKERLDTWDANGRELTVERSTMAVTEEHSVGHAQLFRPAQRHRPTLPSQAALPAQINAEQPPSRPDSKPEKTDADDACSELDPELQALKWMVECFSGREVSLKLNLDALSGADAETIADPGAAQGLSDQVADRPATFGARYSMSEHYREEELTRFSATGQVSTADGRTVDFNVDLMMYRAFESRTNVTVEVGEQPRRKDPLTINFDGGAAQLTGRRFDFDIDADGSNDQVALATGSSAFVALDRNGDGLINDGSELFGTVSGNGFADLAAYDIDANGFIDEGDTVFADLLAWRVDAEGNDQLQSLASLGVGALYLGNVETPYSIRDAGNNETALIRRSGVFIGEDGDVGTLQQVDLVV